MMFCALFSQSVPDSLIIEVVKGERVKELFFCLVAIREDFLVRLLVDIRLVPSNSWSNEHIRGPAQAVAYIVNVVNLATWVLGNEQP